MMMPTRQELLEMLRHWDREISTYARDLLRRYYPEPTPGWEET